MAVRHLLAFLHIPKAAGATVHQVLEDNYPWSSTFTIDGRNFHEATGLICERLQNASSDVGVVKGHMPYGIHLYNDGGNTAYFTILRHPVRRVQSEFAYVLRNRRHFLFQEATRLGSAAEYALLLRDRCLDNIQTRIIGWEGDILRFASPQAGEAQRLLEVAQTRLTSGEVICGLAECFDESLSVLGRVFSWRDIRYRSRNVAPVRRASPSPEEREVIEGVERLDMELYKTAKEAFTELRVRLEGDASLPPPVLEGRLGWLRSMKREGGSSARGMARKLSLACGIASALPRWYWG